MTTKNVVCSKNMDEFTIKQITKKMGPFSVISQIILSKRKNKAILFSQSVNNTIKA